MSSPWAVPDSPGLEDQVKALQEAIGAIPDGVIGPDTWTLLTAYPDRLATASDTNAALIAELDDVRGRAQRAIVVLNGG